MVGIPNGLFFFPLLFGIWTRLNGLARYPFFLNFRIPLNLLCGVFHISPSTPAVLLPLFSVTRLTAKARPPNERVRMCCKALASLGFPSLKAFTIRTWRRRTFLLTLHHLILCQSIGSSRLAPVALMSTPNLRIPVFCIVLKFSRKERPLGSQHPFRLRQILNLYLHHYSTTFASSEIPYPHSHRLTLRLTFPEGEVRAYLVPYKYLTSDLGSAFRPTTLHLRWEKSQFPNLAAHHFGQGISAPFAFLSSRSLSAIHIC